MLKGLFYSVIAVTFSVMDVWAVDERNVEPLIGNVDIWQSSQSQLSEKFPDFSWKYGEEDGEFVHESKDLSFWGQPVHKMDLVESEGAITSLKFTVLDQDTALLMNQSEFGVEAKRWKELVSKQLKSKGTRMPSISIGKVKHLRISWDRKDSIVVLSANIGAKPDRIELTYYKREVGLKYLKLKGQQLKEALPDKKSKDKEGDVDADSHEDESIDDGFAPKEIKSEIRAKIKEISSREAPKGVSKGVQEAVNLLNVYRFLSRVPYDVESDSSMVVASEDAASICKEKGMLSHDFGHSTDKCNLSMNSANMTMALSVLQYMEDPGENNRKARGHRKWCLNHRMGKTGFGLSGAYSAMYSIDGSARGIRKNYSYPGHGFYPVEYLHGNGWSYYSVNGPIPKDCEVQVWKMKKFAEKPPRWSDDPEGREFSGVAKFFYGNSIVFEPDNDPITRKGTYLVRLKGSGFKEQYLVHLY